MIEIDKESMLLKVDYAFIEDRIFTTLSKEEQEYILKHEVYYQMMKDPEPKVHKDDRKKRRKDFWNELPKPKRRRK